MALIQMTNTSDVDTLHIDIDKGDRYNRYSAKWVFAPSEVKSIDEADVEVGVDQPLVDALLSGQLSITETDLDSLTELEVKQFLAAGVKNKYYTAGEDLVADRLVAYDSTNGTIGYPAASGDETVGVLQADATSGEYKRVKFGSVTGYAGGSITSGDKITTDTTGRLITTVTDGDIYVSTATADYTTGQAITFVFNPLTVGGDTIGRLKES